MRTLAFAAVLTVFSSTAFGQSVQLITADEAQSPAAAAKPLTRAISRGPGVRLLSPEAVSGSFAFKVAFEPRGGAAVDLSSVKVEYLKGSGVDLTERVKAGIKPAGIELAAAAAPAGEHPIRVSLRDSDGRLGSAEFKLTVK
jgi:hypothetical protein